MKNSELTPFELAFAENNHGLLIKFMVQRHIDDDFYGALAIRYLSTVKKYCREPRLRRIPFSTVLWYNLRSEMSHHYRRMQRAPKFVSLEDQYHEPSETAATEIDEDIWASIEKRLTEQERSLLRQRRDGKSYAELAEYYNCTFKGIACRFARIKAKAKPKD